MVKFNMLAPVDDALEIDLRCSEEFIIISRANSAIVLNCIYYLIESDEEEFTYFTLKYGPDKVWAR